MAPKVTEKLGESSSDAAKGALKANANGVVNYELPWWVVFQHIRAKTDLLGLRNIVLCFWMI
jgi:hypothetical protein